MSAINSEQFDKPIITDPEPIGVNPVGLTGSKYIGGKLSKKSKTKKNKTKNCKHKYTKGSKVCSRCKYRKLFLRKTKKLLKSIK